MNIDFEKLKRIKNIYFLIIPDDPSSESKTHKLTISKIVITVAAYTIVVALAGFFILGITPLKDWLLPGSGALTSENVSQLEELNEKIVFLTKELESLKSTNERLRYAVILGDSSLVDSLPVPKNPDEKGNKSESDEIEGNILKVFRELFSLDNEEQSKNYYFNRPVNGFISRDFEPEKGHPGIDYVLKSGTPVYASASGYVVFAEYSTKYGYMMIIEHLNDYISIYKHCSTLLKEERDVVAQGELIALSGNTGERTSGPHLHFEIWKDGKPINPKSVMLNY